MADSTKAFIGHKPKNESHTVMALVLGLPVFVAALGGAEAKTKRAAALPAEPAVKAMAFASRKVYQSKQRPSYTSWVSFFPGEKGQWYLTCEEVTRQRQPLPQCSRQQWFEMGLPNGYDKSPYLMEVVMLQSRDDLKTWEVVSRQPCRFQHSAGSFGQARTNDGRFLRFTWAGYSLDPTVKPNEIYQVSEDGGRTWKKMPAFHDSHFASYPHRLRTLRDGTLVLCVPLAPRWGKGTERPTRTCLRLDAAGEMQMTLFISHDQGKTWNGPLPIFGGQNVSETDFVELPEGHLLFFNNSIFAHPGRQFVYRDGKQFTPGFLEKVHSGQVPETICLTREGILVGCMRPGNYSWSDDLGETWQPLAGIPSRGPEVYQPWIHALPDGRIACAGHLGGDDAIGQRDQFLSLHLFQIDVRQRTKDTHIEVEREVDEVTRKYRNSYSLTLTCGKAPLADKELELWYVERDRPGYDSWNKQPLEVRMKAGGKLVKVRTGADGKAHVQLRELDAVEDIHHSYQLVVRFNAGRTDPEYKPVQTPQMEFYANHMVAPGPK